MTATVPLCLPIHLSWRRGVLHGGPWPDGARLPFGCEWSGRGAPWFEAPASRHAVLRRAAGRLGCLLVDDVPAAAALPLRPAPVPLPASLQLALAAFQGGGRRGLVLGGDDAARTDLAAAAIARCGRATVVLAPTAAGVDGWIAALRQSLGGAVGALTLTRPPPPIAVAAVAPFAAMAERWGNRFRLLIADGCDRVPLGALRHGVSCCTATQRLGFVGTASAARLLELSGLFGPLLHQCVADTVTRHVLHLPLGAGERAVYEQHWSRFLAGYDRCAAMTGSLGFAGFVRWARRDDRPALLAWHGAQRALHWTKAKAAACALLLRRHRGQRLLFFTGDRESAYALCRSCHVLPITSELPAAARRQALAAWAAGEVPALCGPRLCEEAHGLPLADVGVVVGGAFGKGQLQARLLRVRGDGSFYQLLSQDTVEVSRQQRQRDGAA